MKRFQKTFLHFIRTWKFSISVSILWMIFWALLWPSILVQKSEGLFAGHPFVWADWSWHLAQTTWFAEHSLQEWRSCFPIYACAKLNYPFLANVISGVLIKMRLPLAPAMTLPSFFESALLVLLMALLFAKVTKKDLVTALAILLFIFSGGLGLWQSFLRVGISTLTQATDSSLFTQIPESGIEFTNIIVGMLVPQRAFLFGLIFAIPALLIGWNFSIVKKASRALYLLFYFCITLLPIAHSHSFFIVGWVITCLAIGDIVSEATWDLRAQSARKWLLLGIPALLLSLMSYIVFLKPSEPTNPFVSVHIGWLAKTGFINIIMFWWKNWGIFLLLAIIGTIFIDRKNKKLQHWAFAWWGVFFLANIIQFQPQIWDNSKFFAWAYLGLSPIASQAILKITQIKRFGKIIAGILFLLVCGSGFADISNLLRNVSSPVQMFSKAQLELSEVVKKTTPQNSIFLTSEYPSNPISSLSGRAIVLGYSGWIYSYGMPYIERQNNVASMYQADQNTTDLLRKYHIDFVLIGDNEQSLNVNELYYSKNFPLFYSNPAGKIYDVRSIQKE